MKLICEEIENVSPVIVEHTSQGKNYFIEGIFMQANMPNKNKREYPLDMMVEEVNRYVNEMVTTKRALGELGHPSGPQINLHLTSHLITELHQDGTNFIGKAKVLNTPNGIIVKGLMDDGVNFGVSSRGLGTLKQNSKGINEVSNYRIATAADIVHDPSAPQAFVRGLQEGCEWIYDAVSDSWVKQELTEALAKESQVPSKQLNESKMLALFERYMKILSSKQ